jgi:hypothetical protein
VLATQGETGPYTSLVSIAAGPDLGCLVFPTQRGSTKYRNLDRRASVALMLDTRSKQGSDLTDAIALTALGTAREAKGEERSKLQSVFLTRHPGLREFLGGSDCALIVVRVVQYILVSDFERKSVLDLGSAVTGCANVDYSRSNG